jgi:hypothetical protein
MRIIKLILPAVIIIILAAQFITGCADEDMTDPNVASMTGTWELASKTIAIPDSTEVQTTEDDGILYTLTLNEDNKFSLISGYVTRPETETGDWSTTGTWLMLQFDNGSSDTWRYILTNIRLTLNQSNNSNTETITLELTKN